LAGLPCCLTWRIVSPLPPFPVEEMIADCVTVMQLTECLTRVNKVGNGPELPEHCNGEVTKLIMGWMGHKMNAAVGYREE
jgi:hypothetical protein